MAGVTAVLAVGILGEGSASDRFALFAMAALALASVLGWTQLAGENRVAEVPARMPTRTISLQWLAATAAVGLFAVVSIQTWFRPGTALAAGDTVLPGGVAWVGRVFDSWTWTGFNLGEPSQLELFLPWAGLLALVHSLGGDPGLAQRLWYTVLFLGAGLGCVALLASLRLGPIATLIGSVLYLLNPYVVSQVAINAVFLAAMVPLAGIPAVLVAAGRGRLSLWQAMVLTGVAAPLVGYVYLNPPLVGMILGAAIATPLLVAWTEGRSAAVRSLRALLCGLLLLSALSVYWIVPAAVHLLDFSAQSLATISSWSWTEGRATLANGLWLNNTWGWSHPEYFPYADVYNQFPISFIRFVLPALAFGILAFRIRPSDPNENKQRDVALRLGTVLSSLALFLIFISTGTNPPGNLVFNPLYSLPFGWLLREPGRFLMLAALAYSILAACLVDAALGQRSLLEAFVRRRAPASSWRISLMVDQRSLLSAHVSKRFAQSAWRLSVVALSLAVALVLGFPIYTGAQAPDVRPLLPPSHVQLPGYWNDMAAFVDSQPVQGAVLVMPPDDFYGMPYSWGYYGADTFIPDLFNRPVLVPNPQGENYVTSPNLVSAVNLAADSILRHDWKETDALVEALNTPLILVRRDVVHGFEGRPTLSADAISQSLADSPHFYFLHREGKLDLYQTRADLRDPQTANRFVTVANQSPDLRSLGVLPPHTALVSSPPVPGHSMLIQAPDIASWSLDGSDISWSPTIAQGFGYTVADVITKETVNLTDPGPYRLKLAGVDVNYGSTTSGGSAASDRLVKISTAGRPAISNGDFSQGAWGPVTDCNDSDPLSTPYIGAQLTGNGAPGGYPAMELSARSDSACVAQPIMWSGGEFFLTMMIDRVQGSIPRICVWETGPEVCAKLPPLSPTYGWSTYSASFNPDAGTSALMMYLYADAPGGGAKTVTGYAHIEVLEFPGVPNLVLIADPISPTLSSSSLMIVHQTFSPNWRGPAAARHVLTDGMLNGWIVPSGVVFSANYELSDRYEFADRVSFAAAVLTLLFVAWAAVVAATRNRRVKALLATVRRGRGA
jgi:arabinofuranan 3-O-arabinosyltransferase